MELFIHTGSDTVRKSDMFRTNMGQWFSSAIINRYMEAVTRFVNGDGHQAFPSALRPCYAFSTLFYTRLKSSGYESVQRWTRRRDIFENRLLLVPVHVHGNHWTLVTIELEDAIPIRLRYFDSLLDQGTTRQEYMEIMEVSSDG